MPKKTNTERYAEAMERERSLIEAMYRAQQTESQQGNIGEHQWSDPLERLLREDEQKRWAGRPRGQGLSEEEMKRYYQQKLGADLSRLDEFAPLGEDIGSPNRYDLMESLKNAVPNNPLLAAMLGQMQMAGIQPYQTALNSGGQPYRSSTRPRSAIPPADIFEVPGEREAYRRLGY